MVTDGLQLLRHLGAVRLGCFSLRLRCCQQCCRGGSAVPQLALPSFALLLICLLLLLQDSLQFLRTEHRTATLIAPEAG